LQGGGTATGVGLGTATITAEYTTNTGTVLVGTASVTVVDPPIMALQISPTMPTVTLANPNVQFTATVIYADYSTRNVTTSATWSSSVASVAVVTAGGRATGIATGTSTITANYGGKVAASTVLTVTDKKPVSLQVTPTNPTTHLGVNKNFVAVVVFDDNTTQTVTGASTWTSENPTVATVGTTGASGGVAIPISAGTTTITATYQGVSGSSVLTVNGSALQSIAITPSPLTPAVGTTQQLTATGTYADSSSEVLTNQVTWLSGDTGILTVSNASNSKGLLTAVSAGTTNVTAVFQSITGTMPVTVLP